jgi:hypothetical protein
VAVATAEAGHAVSALQRYLNARPGARDATTARLLRENFASSSSSTALKALTRFVKIKRYLDAADFTIECESGCDDARPTSSGRTSTCARTSGARSRRGVTGRSCCTRPSPPRSDADPPTP